MTTRTGNRSPLPADPLKACASCQAPRGNKRSGWTPATRDGKVIAWSCPHCPLWGQEPIRREVTNGRVRYLAVVPAGKGRDGKRRQLKRRHDTLEDAREWVEATRAGVARRPDYADPSKLTVAAIADAWLAARAGEVGPNGIRENTLSGYRSSLTGPLMLLGHHLARDVTPGDVEHALRSLVTKGGVRGKPFSHRSATYALGTLRQVFAYAMREEWLTTNPAALAKPPRARHTRRDDDAGALRWTPAELVHFRQHLSTYADGERFEWEPWVHAGMLCTLCGLRRSEVLGLDWQRVAMRTGAVEIAASRTKTGRGSQTAIGDVKAANSARIVQADVIHPGTRDALKTLREHQGNPLRGLVVVDAAGRPVGPDAYSRRFRSLCEEAGVPPLRSVHQVRHSLATAMESADVPMHEAAALLGHDVATYMRFYLSTDAQGAASAAAAAGRVFAV